MEKQQKHVFDPKMAAALCVYLGAAVLCFLNRDKITIATVLLNGNILYAASGVLFSLPVAIAVNSIGTVLMTTTPFFIGKRAGAEKMGALVQKYKKAGAGA